MQSMTGLHHGTGRSCFMALTAVQALSLMHGERT